MKTLKVNEFLELVNYQLSREDQFATQDFKAGICVLAERILRKTKNYNGFNYYYWLKDGYQKWYKDGSPDFPNKNKYLFSKNGGEYDRIYY